MRNQALVRMAIAGVIAVAAFYFTLWVPLAFVPGIAHAPGLAALVSLLVAILAGRYVWRNTSDLSQGLLSTVMMGAVITGGIGFVLGFFGPLVWAPNANQGPLLGIFITGPLGFLLGGVGGGVWWIASRPGRTP